MQRLPRSHAPRVAGDFIIVCAGACVTQAFDASASAHAGINPQYNMTPSTSPSCRRITGTLRDGPTLKLGANFHQSRLTPNSRSASAFSGVTYLLHIPVGERLNGEGVPNGGTQRACRHASLSTTVRNGV